MATITINTYESDMVDGLVQRIEGSRWSERREVVGSVERTVRAYLSEGDYSEGDSDRTVHVSIDGVQYGDYTAPRIRRFQAARKCGRRGLDRR